MSKYLSILLPLAVACSDAGLKSFNSDPEVNITSPTEGEILIEGEVEAIRGQVGDPNHSIEDLSVTWVIDGEEVCTDSKPSELGVVICEHAFGLDGGEVLLEVRDPDGAGASDRVTVEVQPAEITVPPVAELTSPAEDEKYYSDLPIAFTGIVSDTEDAIGDLVVTVETLDLGDLELFLSVNEDGMVEGSSTLAEGNHTVILKVVDTEGKDGTDSATITVGPPNSPPSCAITSPEDGTVVAHEEEVTFAGEVGDVDIGPSLLVVNWTSDIDEVLRETTADSDGAVGFSTSELSVETHRITLEATDELGEPCTDSIYITVGTPPEVAITAPEDGDPVSANAVIIFTAEVGDDQDLATDLSLQWDMDGEVLSEDGAESDGLASFTLYGPATEGFTGGTHVFTLTVTDTDGMVVSDAITLEVNEPPNSPTVTITPDPAVTTDTLSAIAEGSADPDGTGAVSYRYVWFADGIEDTEVTGSEYPTERTSKGNIYSVNVYASDGVHESDPGTAERRVDNSDPVITDVSVSPESGPVGTTVVCEATASDVDDETVSLTYSWSTGETGESITISDSAAPGTEVICTATATDEEGGTDSDTAIVTVTNRPPSIDSVSIDPPTGKQGDALICTATASDDDGGSTTITYEWSDGSSGSSHVIDSSSSPGDILTCTATAIDEYGETASGTATALVENTDPVLDSVFIDPAEPDNENTLTCMAWSSDVDGGTPTLTYAWSTGDTGATLTLTSATRPGEDITCTVTATDAHGGTDTGSASVTVINRTPTIALVTITPTSPTASDEVTCTASGAVDPDGGDVSLSYAWDINDAPAGTETTLSAGYSKGDELTCTVTVTDDSSSTGTASASVTVANTRPDVSDIVLTPSELYTNDTVTAVATAADADGDAFTTTYAFSVNGEVVQDGESASLSGVIHFDKDDTVSVEVTVDDGMGIDTRTSGSIVVLNTPPTAPVVSITATSACPEGWSIMDDGDRCVQVFDTEGFTWFDARDACEDEGGTLVSMVSAADNDQVMDLSTGSPGNSIWIGYNDIASEGDWEWVGGDPETYENWRTAGGEPNGGTVENCVELYHPETEWDGYASYWNDAPCEAAGHNGGYACQVGAEGASGAVQWSTDEGGNGHWYAVRSKDDGITWSEAKAAAEAEGGHLVTLTSEAEDIWVYETLLTDPSVWMIGEGHARGPYIGLYETGGAFEWITGEPSDYFNWVSGDPNGSAPDDVGSFYNFGPAPGHGWSDEDFTSTGEHYIVEWSDLTDVGLICTIDEPSTDADGDPIEYTFDWDVDGAPYTDTDTITYDGDAIPSDALGTDELWTCEVTPDDGDDNGDSGTATYESACELGDDLACPALDCLDLLDSRPDAESGVYWIQPISDTYEAFCNMETDGGGWTLVMKAVDSNFLYSDSVWTTETLHDETDLDITAPGEAKYQSFNEVPFDEILTTDPEDFNVNFSQLIAEPPESSLELFTEPGSVLAISYVSHFNERAPELLQSGGCTTFDRYGFNLYDSLGCTYMSAGGACDHNGGARWGNRVNGWYGGDGNIGGQGWANYGCSSSTSPGWDTGTGTTYLYAIRELLWVR